jgi:hypothetical protein
MTLSCPGASVRSVSVDSPRGSIAVGVAAAAFVVVALALLWGAGEARFRGCVEEVSARYPPIAVSAFSGRQTGPLKVAYDRERVEALEGCGRLPW